MVNFNGTCPRERLRPVLECSKPFNGTARLSYWGYLNDFPLEVQHPAPASDNRFSPPPQARGQPGTFHPGRVRGAFHVISPASGNLVWSLGFPGHGVQSTATSSGSPQQTCADCSALFNCTSCASNFGCGWSPDLDACVDVDSGGSPLPPLEAVSVLERPEDCTCNLPPPPLVFNCTAECPVAPPPLTNCTEVWPPPPVNCTVECPVDPPPPVNCTAECPIGPSPPVNCTAECPPFPNLPSDCCLIVDCATCQGIDACAACGNATSGYRCASTCEQSANLIINLTNDEAQAIHAAICGPGDCSIHLPKYDPFWWAKLLCLFAAIATILALLLLAWAWPRRADRFVPWTNPPLYDAFSM